MNDSHHMHRALALARRGLYGTHPNPRVGCVLVDDAGQVVGEGWHLSPGGAHAEVHAIAQAAGLARGATAYVTLEPCCHHGRTGPCTEALQQAGVRRVVAAVLDPNPLVSGKGLAALREAGIEVSHGLAETEARALNAGFFSRFERGRPWVRAKIAMSLDGRTAMESGESKWITGEDSRADVQRWRARSDAVLTGVGTVLADDPRLNVRPEPLLADLDRDPEAPSYTQRQPLRVIVDSRLRTPPGARILNLDGDSLIATTASGTGAFPPETTLRSPPAASGGVDLHALLGDLAHREINEVQVEAGATLVGALLHLDLIDELLVYLAPVILGSRAKPLATLSLHQMSERLRLRFSEITPIGLDLRMIAQPAGR